MRYKRARLEIVYDILHFIKKNENGVKPTHILYKANLSFPLLEKYLKTLLLDGLICKIVRNKRVLYKLTKKGINFIEEVKKIDKMTKIIEVLHYRRGIL